MYLFGVWLSAYYNWWLNRVAGRAAAWKLGLGIGPVLIFVLAGLSGSSFLLILVLSLSVAVAPGFFAASAVKERQSDLAERHRKQLRKTQDLIKRGIWFKDK